MSGLDTRQKVKVLDTVYERLRCDLGWGNGSV